MAGDQRAPQSGRQAPAAGAGAGRSARGGSVVAGAAAFRGPAAAADADRAARNLPGRRGPDGRGGERAAVAHLPRGFDAADRAARSRGGGAIRARARRRRRGGGRGADPRQRPGQPALSQRDDEPARRAGLGRDRGRRGAARGPGGHSAAARSAGGRGANAAGSGGGRRRRHRSAAAGRRLRARRRLGLRAPRRGGARRGGRVREGGRRRFGHALFREVLYRELADESRRDAARPDGGGAGADVRDHLHRTRRSRTTRSKVPPSMLPRAVDHALQAAERAQELLAYDDAIRTLARARDAVAAAGNPPALCARVLLATGEARIRRGEVEAGKADCREAATIARARDDAELAARAALDLRPRLHLRARRSGPGRHDRDLAGGASARGQRLARAPAGPPRRRAAAEPQGGGAGARGARGDRDRAAPRRQGDAARDLARRDLGADGHRPVRQSRGP